MTAQPDDSFVSERMGVVGSMSAARIVASVIPTTSITCQRFDGAAFVSAQADDIENVASALLLSTGIKIVTGRIQLAGHGFPVGAHLYLSQSTAGAITATEPTGGVLQRVGFVENASTILMNLQEAYSLSGLVDIQQTFPPVVEYTDNAAALAGGLSVGQWYRTGAEIKVVI